MKIVIAPDSFKGSLTAKEAADAIEKGIRRILPDARIAKVPIADGGEGTVQALVDATGGQIVTVEVTGPIGERVRADFGIVGEGEVAPKTAVIEMAAASGLPLVPKGKRNPMRTTTYGTGELIRAALDRGCRKLVIGLGGSATVDGGAGMAQALGARLLDARGQEIPRGGGGLEHLARIDVSALDPRIAETTTIVACDVDNPLVGPRGGPEVFGPQKGATPEMVRRLDTFLERYAEIVRRDLGADVRDVPGAGAAGGLGAGCIAFLGAVLRPGIDIVLEVTTLEKYLVDADIVITGEGRIDAQTVYGKAPVGVAKLAKKYGIPVIAFAGSIGAGSKDVYGAGIDAVMSITSSPMTLETAVDNARELLADCVERAFRVIRLGKGLDV